MVKYGHYGRDLLLELKRTSAERCTNGSGGEALLPPYNDVLVTDALQDLRLHVQALQDQVEAASSSSQSSSSAKEKGKPSMSVRPSILLQNAAIQRNKRCLLAYHVERLHRIQRGLYWNGNAGAGDGNDQGDGGGDGGGRKQLCPAEEDFLSEYASLVRRYAASTGLGDLDGGDFLRSCSTPPLSVSERVQVRVVVPLGVGGGTDEDGDDEDGGGDDAGEVALESGASANFSTAGSTHYLLWNDVEEFVRNGNLQVVDGEEQVG